jgi:hypothetical protein
MNPAEQASMERNPGHRGRGALLKRASLSLILAIAVGAATASRARAQAFQTAACGDQYNALVERAKRCLLKGDTDGAVDWLVAARAELLRCADGTAARLALLSPST